MICQHSEKAYLKTAWLSRQVLVREDRRKEGSLSVGTGGMWPTRQSRIQENSLTSQATTSCYCSLAGQRQKQAPLRFFTAHR